jgi:hypothetical protein
MVDGITPDTMRQSQFVFEATARSPGHSTVTDIPVDDHTVVFKIDKVLHSPAALARSAGMDVTVQLAPGSAVPAVGEQVTLFTRPVAYSDGLAVAEVGRAAPEATGALATMTTGPAPGHRRPHPTLELAHQLEQQRLRAHAADADAIVIGRVVSLEKVTGPALREHDPDWWVATVAVDHTEKGPAGDTVRFVFPNSHDVHWARVPKPAPGATGLWLLHTATGSVAGVAPYALLDPDDVLRPDQLSDLGMGEARGNATAGS